MNSSSSNINTSVCDLLTEKLEHHLNIGRREQRFDPDGVFRSKTGCRYSEPYSLAYKMLEKNNHKHKKQLINLDMNYEMLINPILQDNSRRVVSFAEADRIINTANSIYKLTPIDRIQRIHRYRPGSSVPDLVEYGHVQNYNLHFGSILNTPYYTKFYVDEGLDSSNKEIAVRLQQLRRKKKQRWIVNMKSENRDIDMQKSVSYDENKSPPPTVRFEEDDFGGNDDGDDHILCPVQDVDNTPKIKLGRQKDDDGEYSSTYTSVEHVSNQ